MWQGNITLLGGIDCFSNLWLVPAFGIISTWEIEFCIGEVCRVILLFPSLDLLPTAPHLTLYRPLSHRPVLIFCWLCLAVLYPQIFMFGGAGLRFPLWAWAIGAGSVSTPRRRRKNLIFRRHVLSQHFHPRSCKWPGTASMLEHNAKVGLQGKRRNLLLKYVQSNYFESVLSHKSNLSDNWFFKSISAMEKS